MRRDNTLTCSRLPIRRDMKSLPENQGSGLGQTQAQLLQGCWHETLGVATSRLIHDFNNLLTGILSLSDAYLLSVPPDSPLHEGLTLMNKNARQAVEVVQSLGRLYREQSGPPSYQDLNDLGAQFAALLQKVVPRHTKVVFEAAAESLPVYLDPVEFRKVAFSVALLFASAVPTTGEVSLKSFAPASLEIACDVCQAQSDLLKGFFNREKSPDTGRAELVYDLAMSFLERNGGQLTTRMEQGRAIAVLALRPSDFTELERDLARNASEAK